MSSMDYPQEEKEFQGAWNQLAGEVSNLNYVIAYLAEQSGKAYIAGKDDVAESLRDLLRHFKRRSQELGDKLEGFIKEHQRRDWEIRKAQGRA